MRHHNPRSTSYCSPYYRKPVCSPYQQQYSWTQPTPNRSYVKVLMFILTHPKCKRIDILRGVWGYTASAKLLRGSMSNLFANMLYDDLIDYNDNYEYRVTDYGRRILRDAGVTEITFTTKIAV